MTASHDSKTIAKSTHQSFPMPLASYINLDVNTKKISYRFLLSTVSKEAAAAFMGTITRDYPEFTKKFIEPNSWRITKTGIVIDVDKKQLDREFGSAFFKMLFLIAQQTRVVSVSALLEIDIDFIKDRKIN